VTDHGNVFGAYDFWKQARAAGITPIIGMEGYYVPVGTRFDRQPFELGGPGAEASGEDTAGLAKGRQAYTHMTLLAESTQGMHNLFRLSSLASLEGHYRKPRFDRELLQTYRKGLIATTGCPSGEVNRWLQAGRYDKAVAAAADYRDILGPDHFFVELMDHGLDIERRTRTDLLRLARELDLPLLATNDLHYTFPADAEAHEVLLCVQTGKTLADPGRFRFDARDFYLKSAQEMRAVDRAGRSPAHPFAAGQVAWHDLAAGRRRLRRQASGTRPCERDLTTAVACMRLGPHASSLARVGVVDPVPETHQRKSAGSAVPQGPTMREPNDEH
jgi:DNA polymerase-3 subunit alpha